MPLGSAEETPTATNKGTVLRRVHSSVENPVCVVNRFTSFLWLAEKNIILPSQPAMGRPCILPLRTPHYCFRLETTEDSGKTRSPPFSSENGP